MLFRFQLAINNAWGQGETVVAYARKLDPHSDRVSFANLVRSYLSCDDSAMKENPTGDYQLDDPPARWFILSIWVWWQSGIGGWPVPGDGSLPEAAWRRRLRF